MQQQYTQVSYAQGRKHVMHYKFSRVCVCVCVRFLFLFLCLFPFLCLFLFQATQGWGWIDISWIHICEYTTIVNY